MTSPASSRFPRALATAFVSWAGCALLIAGCYDTDPQYVAKPPSPTLSPDASPCEACAYGEIEGLSPACAPEQVECAESGNCVNIMRCINQEGCFEGASFEDMVKCGTPCALANGAASADDPAVQAGLFIGQCIVTQCTSACL